MIRLVYIAGPFRADNAWEIEQNIRRAEELALGVWEQEGFAAICPHANTRFFDRALPDERFLDGDLEILKRCDALLGTRDWRRSKGATVEVEFAKANGIPCFDSIAELVTHDWDRREDHTMPPLVVSALAEADRMIKNITFQSPAAGHVYAPVLEDIRSSIGMGTLDFIKFRKGVEKLGSLVRHLQTHPFNL